ncbi:glycosyltransferase family 39 protein [Dyadobacter sp. LJ53]|uniref:ArnT family glycosyltransferase n=1 Tax=Dyadobacter chenwenxiniae TaxID=2906456 RepID=UPI001F45154E|nr:glycosyltransferase family 39 protein [Dyadobacter chenwenxiniae]MCF0052287.1 glycosyltransferase family 39 protein [Dyadobacter chenwenxiniae]
MSGNVGSNDAVVLYVCNFHPKAPEIPGQKFTIMRDVEPVLQRYFPWLLIIGIALNVPGLWLEIIEPDGALYATIAKRMVLHRDWINLWGHGQDWLDKPHFPFWMAAISYSFFGITSFAYKFPAFLFWLLGLYYTFLTARDLFNVSVARISVLISAVALHSTLANFDVRAEPYLTTCIIAAVWHMLGVYQKKSGLHIVAAALFAACAIMTKGIFVLLTIGGGWVLFWIFTSQWQQFINYRWWVMLILCLLFITPELYSLYAQFDLHPEKVVFGKTGVSGLKFFFWDSQFGRFFNTGPIKGSGNVTFFMHTTLWAFLPWSVGLVGGIVYLIRFDTNRAAVRWTIYGSTLLTFILFSLSRFQLPHYILILFPYFSIITGYFLYQKSKHVQLHILAKFQQALVFIAAIAVIALLYFTGLKNEWLATGVTCLIVAIVNIIPFQNPLQRILYNGYAMAAIIYIFLFLFFYPFLLQFQSGRSAARTIWENDPKPPVAIYKSLSHSLEFYAPGEVMILPSSEKLSAFLTRTPCYIYTSPELADSLLKSGLKADMLATPAYFRITKLKSGFLNKDTRNRMLEKMSLLYVR